MKDRKEGKLSQEKASNTNQRVMMQMLELRAVGKVLESAKKVMGAQLKAVEELQLEMQTSQAQLSLLKKQVRWCQSHKLDETSLELDKNDENKPLSERLGSEIEKRLKLSKNFNNLRKRQQSESQNMATNMKTLQSVRKKLKSITEKAVPVLEFMFKAASKENAGELNSENDNHGSSSSSCDSDGVNLLPTPLFIIHHAATCAQKSLSIEGANFLSVEVDGAQAEVVDTKEAKKGEDLLLPHDMSVAIGLKVWKYSFKLRFRYHPKVRLISVEVEGSRQKSITTLLDRIVEGDKGDELIKNVCATAMQSSVSITTDQPSIRGCYLWAQQVCGLSENSSQEGNGKSTGPLTLQQVVQRIAKCLK
eukprot:CAMPEP_0167763808 /NCGR_PEP_ID=MMETSP0110_2-20121227/13622_1 /TAXON_ID=629695 /ORGANISM="Gymnochlora sp., Strain CCMP2014" /LENGTH=362 /DNA_ID=CAMNT_0007651021 /DNA_START=26 /DNA_END=1114 /DNA_ORIENTATION=-